MKKITKLGLSALCGSLAAVTVANAGSVDVTGSAHMTWTTLGNKTTGNPMGMKSNLSFTGSGELDNGNTFKLSIVHTDKASYSAAELAVTLNSLGTIALSQANGGGLGGFDDVAPTAWEETWDTGTGATPDRISGVGSSTHINWKSPKVTKGGSQLILAYAPENDGVQVSDKSSSGAAASNLGAGFDIVANMNPDGKLNWFVGYSRSKQTKGVGYGGSGKTNDKEEATIGINYSIGPFALGAQRTIEDLKPVDQGAGRASVVSEYHGMSWGAALNINEGLSVSYGEHTSNKIWTSQIGPNDSTRYTPKKKMKGSSYQAGYTIGGVTVKFADSTYDNAAYSEGNTVDNQTISVGIAF